MAQINSINELKRRIQAGFDNNEKTLQAFGKTYSTQLKAHLLESNRVSLDDVGCPDGSWEKMDKDDWYFNSGGNFPNGLFVDTTRDRVWIVYSLMEASDSDFLINKWVRSTMGLDHCWLSRSQLLHWKNTTDWEQRGLGVTSSPP